MSAEVTTRPSPSVDAFAESVHKYILEHIQLADTKAAFMSTVAAALMAFLDRSTDSVNYFLMSPLRWTLRGWLAFFSTLLLTTTIVAALGVVVPRRKGGRQGLIFWEAVADQPTGAAYSQVVMGCNAEDLVREKLDHCYTLAHICRRKYRWLDAAVRIGAAGLVCTMIFLATR